MDAFGETYFEAPGMAQSEQRDKILAGFS